MAIAPVQDVLKKALEGNVDAAS
ncbi:MAG: hypothetical protein RL407_935, partial [Bacteroidota bacterium]